MTPSFKTIHQVEVDGNSSEITTIDEFLHVVIRLVESGEWYWIPYQTKKLKNALESMRDFDYGRFQDKEHKRLGSYPISELNYGLEFWIHIYIQDKKLEEIIEATRAVEVVNMLSHGSYYEFDDRQFLHITSILEDPSTIRSQTVLSNPRFKRLLTENYFRGSILECQLPELASVSTVWHEEMFSSGDKFLFEVTTCHLSSVMKPEEVLVASSSAFRYRCMYGDNNRLLGSVLFIPKANGAKLYDFHRNDVQTKPGEFSVGMNMFVPISWICGIYERIDNAWEKREVLI